jgi:hypothetical protein
VETEDKGGENRLLWKLQIRTGRKFTVENEGTDWENIILWKLKIGTGRIDYCGN